MVQMDWLLGSASGLLFKIREELYGLKEGYDRIFWPHAKTLQDRSSLKPSVHFILSSTDLLKKSVA